MDVEHYRCGGRDALRAMPPVRPRSRRAQKQESTHSESVGQCEFCAGEARRARRAAARRLGPPQHWIA